MNAHKLFGSCFNKPLDSLNKLRVSQRFVYLSFKYFPFPAFRQGTDAHSLLHVSSLFPVKQTTFIKLSIKRCVAN